MCAVVPKFSHLSSALPACPCDFVPMELEQEEEIVQERDVMGLDEGYQEFLESMDHTSPQLVAVACDVLSGWSFWGASLNSHPNDGPCAPAMLCGKAP